MCTPLWWWETRTHTHARTHTLTHTLSHTLTHTAATDGTVSLSVRVSPGNTRNKSVWRWCLPSTEQAEGFPVSVRLPVSLSVRSISLSVCLPVPQRARQGTSLCRCGAYRPQNKRRVSPLCEGVGASWAVRSGRTLYCTLGSRTRMDVPLQPKSPILVLCQ